jgi:hypothetical protein
MNRMKNLFIDASKLQVGDVLLSQSTHAHSKFIAWSTAGPYSHAAIYLREFQLFEAVTKGVGFANFKPVKVERAPRTLCSTEGYRKFAVYRCPPQFRQDLDKDKLYLDIYPLLAVLNGVEYKRLNAFVRLKTRFDWLPRGIRSAMLSGAGLLAGDRNKCLEEFFCSEAVVYLLQKMGMAVLKASQSPDTVTPNQLTDPAISNLQEVPDVVCTADKRIANDELALLGAQTRAFRVSSLKIVQSTKKLQKFTDDLLQDMHESIVARRKKAS